MLYNILVFFSILNKIITSYMIWGFKTKKISPDHNYTYFLVFCQKIKEIYSKILKEKIN